MEMGYSRFIYPPLDVDIDGCSVTLVNIKRVEFLGKTRYIVSCKITCTINGKQYTTRIFPLDVLDNNDLINQLKKEVNLFKLFIYSGRVGEVVS
ncbi:MAG: hypothetical protein QXN17_02390 [Nitrososphaerota archaeon]